MRCYSSLLRCCLLYERHVLISPIHYPFLPTSDSRRTNIAIIPHAERQLPENRTQHEAKYNVVNLRGLVIPTWRPLDTQGYNRRHKSGMKSGGSLRFIGLSINYFLSHITNNPPLHTKVSLISTGKYRRLPKILRIFTDNLPIHPSMFISQKSQIRNMEHTLVQSKSEWCNKTQ